MRVRLECALPAERVLLALRDEPWPFALTGRWAGGGAIVGASPRALLGADEDPFTRLEDLPEPSGDAEVGGGWFGWLGYGLGGSRHRRRDRFRSRTRTSRTTTTSCDRTRRGVVVRVARRRRSAGASVRVARRGTVSISA